FHEIQEHVGKPARPPAKPKLVRGSVARMEIRRLRRHDQWSCGCTPASLISAAVLLTSARKYFPNCSVVIRSGSRPALASCRLRRQPPKPYSPVDVSCAWHSSRQTDDGDRAAGTVAGTKPAH